MEKTIEPDSVARPWTIATVVDLDGGGAEQIRVLPRDLPDWMDQE